ncbi:MAG: dynamin family protein [Burkholderiales bacterium]|jgi:hypothetical protein|nr:dynamin family protein [Burkholderiales bacterium]
MAEQAFVSDLKSYSAWRRQLIQYITQLESWLSTQSLSDALTDQTFANLKTRLSGDRLVVAFVAEFSRGKSELINALFFAQYGQRLLPSSAGRTTMCPTELLYQEDQPPALYLLPVETRREKTSIADHKKNLAAWTRIPLDHASPHVISETLKHLSEVKYVPLSVAQEYGFFSTDEDAVSVMNDERNVEIPSWRHAILNFPHPILQQGLVILDTPGLNAIGVEPELTFSLLPGAHSVLYILAADAGVTKTDLAIWSEHLAAEDMRNNHMVVLNKIDGLWDDLKTRDQIQQEINKQVEETARVLDVPPSQIFALSAQKGLLAKIHQDQHLLERSALLKLEDALANRMLPSRRKLVANATGADLYMMVNAVRDRLDTREDALHEQLRQLSLLRGKNQSVIAAAFERSGQEKEHFEQNLARYSALRHILTNQINILLDAINVDTLKQNTTRTHAALTEAKRTVNARALIDHFFTVTQDDLSSAEKQANEIFNMICGVTRKFAEDVKLRAVEPQSFSFARYQREIKRLQSAHEARFDALWGRSKTVKLPSMQRFFEAIVTRARYIYEVANRDAESWLKSVLVPLEVKMHERHQQLRKHQESARQIALANSEIEQHAGLIKEQLEALKTQQIGFDAFVRQIDRSL